MQARTRPQGIEQAATIAAGRFHHVVRSDGIDHSGLMIPSANTLYFTFSGAALMALTASTQRTQRRIIPQHGRIERGLALSSPACFCAMHKD
jgi:hypothetical protein